MWKFISAARLAQIEADARLEGYIKAVHDRLATSDVVKEAKQGQQIREPYAGNLRTVTSGNTQAAEKAVQEIKQHVNQAVIGRKRRSHFKSPRGRYGDPNLRLIANGAIVEEYILKNIGKLTQVDIANNIVKKMGTHVRGCRMPIKVIDKFINHVIHRRLVWDTTTNAFVNIYWRSRTH